MHSESRARGQNEHYQVFFGWQRRHVLHQAQAPSFTVIDCCLSDANRVAIVDEIKREMSDRAITRFISTHPDEDHIQQLDYLDDEIQIVNFYCVENQATKPEITAGFERYCELRDSNKAYFISMGCTRKWLNQDGVNDSGIHYRGAGISILWPDVKNEHYQEELRKAADGVAFNNISCIIRYSLEGGVAAIWMGDLETEFMEEIVDDITLPKTNLLFAPHHGRKSGRIPARWIAEMDPDIIIMGEAGSRDSDYTSYLGHNKIRQNSAKDITFECERGKIHCYSSNPSYSVDFLEDEGASTFDYYLGTLYVNGD